MPKDDAPREMTPEACADFLDWWAGAFEREPYEVEDPEPLLDLVLEGERRDGPTYFARDQLEAIGRWFLRHREQAAERGEKPQHEELFVSLFDRHDDGIRAVGVAPLIRAWEQADAPAELFDRRASELAGTTVTVSGPHRIDRQGFHHLVQAEGLELLELRVLDRAFILRDGQDLYRVPVDNGMVHLGDLTVIHPMELGQNIENALERLDDEFTALKALLGDQF